MEWAMSVEEAVEAEAVAEALDMSSDDFARAYRAFAAESHARLADLWPRRADINAYVELASSLLGRGRDRT